MVNGLRTRGRTLCGYRRHTALTFPPSMDQPCVVDLYRDGSGFFSSQQTWLLLYRRSGFSVVTPPFWTVVGERQRRKSGEERSRHRYTLTRPQESSRSFETARLIFNTQLILTMELREATTKLSTIWPEPAEPTTLVATGSNEADVRRNRRSNPNLRRSSGAPFPAPVDRTKDSRLTDCSAFIRIPLCLSDLRRCTKAGYRKIDGL